MKISKLFRPIAGAMILATLAIACGSGAPPVPTTSSNAVSTVVAATLFALTQQAALNTPTAIPPTAVPATPIPPTFPVLAPTQVLPVATRINFLSGATTAEVSAPIGAGQTQFYVLKALQSQPMIAMVFSLNNDVTLSVKTQGGTSLLNASAKQTTWQGILPQTEDYYIGIYGGASAENFTLSLEIPARIKFAVGKDSAIVSGQTTAGYNVSYVVFASQGQKMSVDLNGVGNNGALTIYGFSDGQPYLRSVAEQTSFSMTLPSSQDYIIKVVPRAGMVINYTLVVKIK